MKSSQKKKIINKHFQFNFSNVFYCISKFSTIKKYCKTFGVHWEAVGNFLFKILILI